MPISVYVCLMIRDGSYQHYLAKWRVLEGLAMAGTMWETWKHEDLPRCGGKRQMSDLKKAYSAVKKHFPHLDFLFICMFVTL